MDIKQRAQNILMTPDTEWPVIATEATPTGSLITSYVMPLVAIGAIAGFIGGSLVGVTVPFVCTYRVPIMMGLAGAVFSFVMGIVVVFIVAFLINALAPTFGAEQNPAQATKVAIYSYTPAWLAGIFQIIPALGILGLLAALYGLYLMYLGLQRVMKSPADKAVGYTAVVVVCAIVLSVVVAMIGGIVMAPVAMMSGAGTSAAPEFDPDSPMGKLEALGRSMEQSEEKMAAARKSGDANAEAAAAFEGLGALLGGGRRVDAVSVDQLTPLIPETFAGFAKRSSNAERTGMAGIMVTTAEATYANDAGASVGLEITDTGGASGMMGLASWANLQGEKENDQESERTTRVGGRLVHERASKTGGTNEYSTVLAERFLVSAKSDDLGVDGLRDAVNALDLPKLEAMKGTGVAK